MKTLSTTLKVLTCALFIMSISSIAQAQATRTWVSGVGDDVNPCSRTAPCKTFAGAVSKTFINGEIDALDGGGFGSVTLTKSMTLDGAGGFGSILASGTNGVSINIASGNVNDPKRRVTLRRLSINGTGASGAVGTNTGLIGVRGTSSGFAELYIENTYIQNFATAGVDINFAAASGARIGIKDTNITNTNIGIQGTTSSGFVNGVFDKVRIEGVIKGVVLKDRTSFGIRDSVIQNCSTAGVSVEAPSNISLTSLKNAYIFSCNVGVAAGGAGTSVDFSDTIIVGNSTGVTTGGATLSSNGHNRIFGNSSNGTAPTIAAPQ